MELKDREGNSGERNLIVDSYSKAITTDGVGRK